jgi:hypothetical protein
LVLSNRVNSALQECTLREEHILGVFENKVLRRIFGQNKDEIKRGWRKPYNKEFHNLYALYNII